MFRNSKLSWGKSLFFVWVLLFSVPGFSQSLDWPTFRHDPGFTGRSQGQGGITHPTVKWSYYLGGSLSATRSYIGDLTGDGRKDIAMIVGGKVALKTPQGQTLWFSDALNASYIIGAWDFDRNGEQDLLVLRANVPAAVVILNGKTGETLWYYDAFGSGASKSVPFQARVGDLDGDGYPDLVTKPRSFYEYTHAFSFRDGFQTPAELNELWHYQHQTYTDASAYVIGDVDNDGSAEVVFWEAAQITILNGEDGTEQTIVPPVFQSYFQGISQIVNVDDDPQNEIVALSRFHTDYGVLVYDAVKKEVSWSYQWFPTAGKGIAIAENSVSDLNGDGQVDVALSVYNNTDNEYSTPGSVAGDYDGISVADQWTLAVYDASDGAVQATLANVYLHGIEDLDNDGLAELIVQRVPANTPSIAAFGPIEVYSLVGTTFVFRWSIADAAPFYVRPQDKPDQNVWDYSLQIAAQDVNGDQKQDLYFLLDQNNDGLADHLRAVRSDLASPIVLADWPIPDGESIVLLTLGNELSQPGELSETAIYRSSGYLDILSNTLSQQAHLQGGTFSSSPLVADLDDDGHSELIVTRSSTEFEVLNLSTATALTPPERLWAYRGETAPFSMTIDLNGDGNLEIPAADVLDAVNPKIHLLDEAGEAIWTKEFTGYGSAPQDIAFGDVNLDDVRDAVVTIADTRLPAESDMRLVALDGTDGTEIWNVATSQNYRWVAYRAHLLDITGDGREDVIFHDTYNIEYYNGLDGSLISSVNDTHWLKDNILADFDNDDEQELLIVNFQADKGIQLFELLTESPSFTIPHDYSDEVWERWLALYSHPDGLGFIKSSTMGYLQAFGPDGQADWSGRVWPRNGELGASDPGDGNTLSNLTVCDIDGNGEEDVIFGTDDGFLMAMQLSDQTLLWALPFSVTVSEPVVADVDQDGELEILVATDDGQLHLIDQEDLSAPGEVRDVQLSADYQLVDPSVDIDSTETPDALAASWDDVTGASGYLASVLDDQGNRIVSWVDTGLATDYIVPVSLILNRSYTFQVKAYDDTGRSSLPASSDGVMYMDLTNPVISSFTATPTAFNPLRESTTFHAELEDSSELHEATLNIRDVSNDLQFESSFTLQGKLDQIEQVWTGRDSMSIPLPDGMYTASLSVLDIGDNETTQSLLLYLDTHAPDAPVIEAPTDGAQLTELRPTFSGQTEALSSVTVWMEDQSAALCTVAASASGDFSCVSESDLQQGEQAVVATAMDGAGNTSIPSNVVHFEILAIVDGDLDQESSEGETGDSETPWVDGDIDKPGPVDGDVVEDGDVEFDSESDAVADGDVDGDSIVPGDEEYSSDGDSSSGDNGGPIDPTIPGGCENDMGCQSNPANPPIWMLLFFWMIVFRHRRQMRRRS